MEMKCSLYCRKASSLLLHKEILIFLRYLWYGPVKGSDIPYALRLGLQESGIQSFNSKWKSHTEKKHSDMVYDAEKVMTDRKRI